MPVAFTLSQDAFLGLAKRVNRVTERRNTIPILSNVRVEATASGAVTVTATDLDIWAEASTQVAAEVTTPGVTTVPGGMLVDILGKAGKGAQIHFASQGEGRAEIRAGRARFLLNELPEVDFPAFPARPGESTAFTLAPKHLKRIVDEVSFAISTEETRYYLNGIHCHAGPAGELVSVATDGHRLSQLTQALDDQDLTGMVPIIVPRKTVSLFGLLVDCCGEDETASVTCDDTKIVFEVPGLTLSSKLIDGTFPDYNRVIPTANSDVALLPVSALEEAVDRVTTVSNEKGRAVKVTVAEDATVRLDVLSPDAGQGTDEVEATFESAAFALEIGFNGRYVIDALKTFSCLNVRCAFAAPGSPVLITVPGDDSRRVVLMPMRV